MRCARIVPHPVHWLRILSLVVVVGLSSCNPDDGPPFCIGEDTPVLTPTGEVPIQQLRVGDTVLSVDPASGEVVRAVITSLREARRGCVRLESPDGTVLFVTRDHPIYAPDRQQYVSAGEWPEKGAAALRVHAEVRLGGILELSSLSRASESTGVRRVYDLTVNSSLENFVAAGFLVHNKTPPYDPIDRTTARTVLDAVARVWNERNSEDYALLLAPEFQFVFDPADPDSAPFPIWYLEHELWFCGSLFRDDRVERIVFHVREVEGPFVPEPSEMAPPGAFRYTVHDVGSEFDVRDPKGGIETIQVERGLGWFYLREDPVDRMDGKPTWEIVEWRDRGAAQGSLTWSDLRVDLVKALD